MVWYKKQLMEKLKANETKKKKTDHETKDKPAKRGFDPSKIKDGKHAFRNPVAARNRNRKKTDLPSA